MMEIPMNTAALVLACMATLSSPPAENTLTYTASRGSETNPITLTIDGESLLAATGPGFDLLATPIRNLPFWLPPDLRKVGGVVYDDGKGFMHDKGREVYVLKSTEKWKGFDAVGLSYRCQGMRQAQNWMLQAHYDTTTGFLLSAKVSTRLGDQNSVTCELTLTSSSDPAVLKKLR
jgi:hypothetical protein